MLAWYAAGARHDLDLRPVVGPPILVGTPGPARRQHPNSSSANVRDGRERPLRAHARHLNRYVVRPSSCRTPRLRSSA
jgi:hypothetical protein